MPFSLDDYRSKLVNKVLLAGAEQEVKRFCDAALKSLEQHNVNGYVIIRFVDKIINDLEGFNPRNKNLQQWSNIQSAKKYFIHLKQNPITPVH